MSRTDDLERENEALRSRLSRLSEASLRLNESLDFDTVLQGVLESARSLTNARYGVMTLLDDAGQVREFLSAGMTVEESERVWKLPGRWKLYEQLSNISSPLRIRDMLAHLKSLDVEELRSALSLGPVLSLLVSPVLHSEERVGNIYVAGKGDGEEFTQEDEETLVMFSSQAAMVVANARRHREEQRARTDLETLVNTCPIGVVVFDARTGAMESINREAMRIGEGLLLPGQSPEQLLEVLTLVRGDGREVSPRQLPIAERLSIGETVRAEEIVMRVPDGRSVTTLLNATPIRTEDGEVVSVVITLQDMTPLEDIERQRAEFLGMVSHELRTPLATIKGSTTTLLGGNSDLDPAEMAQFHRIMDQQVDHMQDLIGDLLDVARIETGTLSVKPMPVDVPEIVDEARSRFASEGGRHSLHIELAPDLPGVMADRRRMVQVMTNLLSNAAKNSPEGSPIRVSAARDGVHVAVAVSDGGRGIPSELLPRLFRKFSRIDGGERQGDIAGAGLGLSICKGIVEAHGGRIWVESAGPELGARFTFTVPAVEEGTGGVMAPTPLSAGLRRSSRGKLRILAVDDDPQALRYIRDALTKAGYAPIVTGDPQDVHRLMKQEKPHLVLLDLRMPGCDGIDLMNRILRKEDIPVIFVSVYGQDDVIARAFDMGAADYVVKPFSPTELAARIRATLRKRAVPSMRAPYEPYAVGDLTIDYAGRRVRLAGRQVDLTPTEFGVLHELSVHGGRPLTHDQLLQQVWGMERRGEPWLVREVVKRLRRKLGDDAQRPRYILTETRVGYRMARSEEWEHEAE